MKILIASGILALLVLPGLSQTSKKNDDTKFDADYFLMRQEYSKALDLYLDVQKTEPDNADIKYRIGYCYLNSEDEKDKAVRYLEEAVQKVSVRYNINSFKETSAPIEAYFLLGSAYRVNNRLDDAIAAYQKYKEYLNPKDEYNLNAADQYIKSCELAREMLQTPRNVLFTNLGRVINNSQPNFNAVTSGNGKVMAFTSPGRQGYEIYFSTLTDTVWSTPKNISSTLGAGKYMKTCSLSNDGTTLLLVMEDPLNSDLFISHFKKGRWSKAEALKKPINGKLNETHASLSADNKTMYFTSNRKGGLGDLDIYRSMLEGDNWGKPQNLGPAINTPYNEETPFVSGDGQILYFSSEGHSGMGGYDVFRYDFSHPEAGAVNLGYPINTTDNNLFYMPVGDGSSAYYSFRGPDSYGGRDIYKVTVLPDTKPEQEVLAAATVAATQVEEPKADTMTVAEEPKQEVPVEAEPKQEVPPAVLPAQEVPVAVVVQQKQDNAMEAAKNRDKGVSAAKSFTVQFMALRKPADLQYFKGLSDIAVTYGSDAWYRYTWTITTDSLKAVKIRNILIERGYSDAFIRGKGIVPSYTIQVMAVPGPVTDLTRFNNLPEISVIKGTDTFCRYTTGEFDTKEEALSALEQIKSLGYSKAFVSRVIIQ
jgi:tetratricopeptide (TPR) repeat protein